MLNRGYNADSDTDNENEYRKHARIFRNAFREGINIHRPLGNPYEALEYAATEYLPPKKGQRITAQLELPRTKTPAEAKEHAKFQAQMAILDWKAAVGSEKRKGMTADQAMTKMKTERSNALNTVTAALKKTGLSNAEVEQQLLTAIEEELKNTTNYYGLSWRQKNPVGGKRRKTHRKRATRRRSMRKRRTHRRKTHHRRR